MTSTIACLGLVLCLGVKPSRGFCPPSGAKLVRSRFPHEGNRWWASKLLSTRGLLACIFLPVAVKPLSLSPYVLEREIRTKPSRHLYDLSYERVSSLPMMRFMSNYGRSVIPNCKKQYESLLFTAPVLIHSVFLLVWQAEGPNFFGHLQRPTELLALPRNASGCLIVTANVGVWDIGVINETHAELSSETNLGIVIHIRRHFCTPMPREPFLSWSTESTKQGSYKEQSEIHSRLGKITMIWKWWSPSVVSACCFHR